VAAEPGENRVWTATDIGLVLFDGDLYEIAGLEGSSVSAIELKDNTTLWAETAEKRLFEVQTKNNNLIAL